MLTLVWSEFGRRAEENGSGGTDHGAAGIGLPHRHARGRHDDRRVPGPRGGSTRTATSSATSDFRGVYASMLEQWLGFDAARVIPGAAKFKRYKLVK